MSPTSNALFVFDLGETLVHYQGVPLDWSSHYRPALLQAFAAGGIHAHDEALMAGEALLMQYNTRHHPRDHEVAQGEVLGRLAQQVGVSRDVDAFEQAFFRYFQRRAVPAPGALPLLQSLVAAGVATAVLSDVPYGMPRHLVEEDLGSLLPLCDAVVTSCEVGWRKPDPRGLYALMERFGVSRDRTTYIGNERKDMQLAERAGVRAVLVGEALPDCRYDTRVARLDEIVLDDLFAERASQNDSSSPR